VAMQGFPHSKHGYRPSKFMAWPEMVATLTFGEALHVAQLWLK
jgi:hypothetical protein